MSILALPLTEEKLYLGNYRPVSMYQGDRKIAGWTWTEKQGAAVEFEDTYNDAVHGVIGGKSEQAVTVQGKNLFDKNRRTDLTYIEVTGGARLGHTTYCSSDYITVAQNTNYVGSKPHQGAFYNSSKTFLSAFVSAAGSSFTSPANAAYLRTSTPMTGVDAFQIELGPTATPYEPFIPNSPSPDYPSPIHSAGGYDLKSESADGIKSSSIAIPILRSLPNGVKDTLTYKGGGMWEHVQRVGVKVFDGTEPISVVAGVPYFSGLSDRAFAQQMYFCVSHFTARVDCLSGGANVAALPDDNMAVMFYASGNSNRHIYFKTSLYPDATTFKSWLAAQYAAGTPITVVYELATPMITMLNLGELKTYPHETQIHQDTTGLLADLTLTARVVDKEAE